MASKLKPVYRRFVKHSIVVNLFNTETAQSRMETYVYLSRYKNTNRQIMDKCKAKFNKDIVICLEDIRFIQVIYYMDISEFIKKAKIKEM